MCHFLVVLDAQHPGELVRAWAGAVEHRTGRHQGHRARRYRRLAPARQDLDGREAGDGSGPRLTFLDGRRLTEATRLIDGATLPSRMEAPPFDPRQQPDPVLPGTLDEAEVGSSATG